MPPITQQLQAAWNEFPMLLSGTLLAIGILAASFLISRWLARAAASAARRQKADAGVQEIVRRLTRWGVMILGGVLAAEQVIPNVTSLLAGLGIAGFTIGCARRTSGRSTAASLRFRTLMYS